MSQYAKDTQVPAGRSRAEIETTLDVAGLDVVYSTDGMSEEEEQALCAA